VFEYFVRTGGSSKEFGLFWLSTFFIHSHVTMNMISHLHTNLSLILILILPRSTQASD
jgi:hypothetical protein